MAIKARNMSIRKTDLGYPWNRLIISTPKIMRTELVQTAFATFIISTRLVYRHMP